MSTDPKTMRHDGSERRPSGAESKGDARGQPGGQRSSAGSDYGDWVPDRNQPRGNDDRGAEPQVPAGGAGSSELGPAAKAPGHERPRAGSSEADDAAADAADSAEAAAESNRNKDFDTPHVHSSTTSRKV